MKKRLLVLTTIAVMGLSACSGGSQPAATTAPAATEAATEAPDETEAEVKPVAPMECTMDVDNLEDGIYPATLKLDTLSVEEVDEENTEIMLMAEIFNADLYDAVEITTLKPGDKVIVYGEEVEVEKVEDVNGTIQVNGGLDEGGFNFRAGEGGTYKVVGFDDHTSYTSIGEIDIYIDDDTVLIDKSDLENPDGVEVKGAEIAEYLEDAENKEFNHLNTTITFEHGYLTEINRVYIP